MTRPLTDFNGRLRILAGGSIHAKATARFKDSSPRACRPGASNAAPFEVRGLVVIVPVFYVLLSPLLLVVSVEFRAVAVLLTGFALLALHLRYAEGRKGFSSRAFSRGDDLKVALNELATAAHKLQRTSRQLHAVSVRSEPGTVDSLRRLAFEISEVSEIIDARGTARPPDAPRGGRP
jgi:hypothetical protein